MAEIGVERCDEVVPARENGLLEFLEVGPALLQRRGAVAQEGGALARKRRLQGAICVRVQLYFAHGVHRGLLSRC
jgi:hypothetical protein